MNAKWTVAVSLALLTITAHVGAQTDRQLSSAAIQSALNAPPKQLHAQIVGIDAGARSLTLKGVKGRVITVAVGKEVTNFDTLKIGDRVDVQVRDAMLIRATKASPRLSQRYRVSIAKIKQSPCGVRGIRRRSI